MATKIATEKIAPRADEKFTGMSTHLTALGERSLPSVMPKFCPIKGVDLRHEVLPSLSNPGPWIGGAGTPKPLFLLIMTGGSDPD